MKPALPVLALALITASSAAQAKVTQLTCTDANDHHGWVIELDDGPGLIGTAKVNGDNSAPRRAVFRPEEVRIDWAVGLTMIIDRTTLQYHLFEFGAPPTSAGLCRMPQF